MVGKEVINPGPKKEDFYHVPNANFAIWCDKSSPVSADLTMNTSAGPITVHSFGFSVDIPDREKIMKALAINSSDIVTLQDKTSTLRGDIDRALGNDSTLDGKLSALQNRADHTTVDTVAPDVSPWGNFHSQWFDVICPPGTVMIGYSFVQSDVIQGPLSGSQIQDGKIRIPMAYHAKCSNK